MDDLNDAIIFHMKQNGHYDNTHNQPYIILSPNTSTLKPLLEIAQGYKVDFTVSNSFNKMLGFKEKWYHSGYNESEHIVDILAINSILIELSIVQGSYLKGQRKPIIYSFFPNVSPGYKIVEIPRNLVYLPIIGDEISSITMKLTDQNGKLLNMRGEKINMRFHIREI